MSVEDRLRTATRARADLVSDIPPLDLPARERVRRPGAFGTRRWVSWAAPVTAAAVVVALAVTLVSLRQARNAPTVPAAAQSGTSATSAVSAPPGFYADINIPFAPGPTTLILGRTGARAAISTVRSPKGQSFAGVTGAADDRTFVVAAEAYPAQKGAYSGAPVAWYLLRVPTAVGQAAKLTKLAIPAQPKGTQVSGIALSPNGDELVVLFQRDVWSGTRGPLTLTLYSVSTGRALRTWTQQANGARVGFGWYSGLYSNTSITWLDGQTLAFDEGVYSPPASSLPASSPPLPSPQLDPVFSDVKIRTLSLSSPGGSLLADSKVVFTARNSSCDTLQLTADGKSVFCGTSSGSADSKSSAYDPRIFEYSVATGKSRLVYRRAGVYNYGVADVLWLNADGSSLVGAVFDQTKMARGALEAYQDAGPIAKGILKTILFPTFGPPFAGQIAF
jgi:hypothetical protein